MKLLRWSHRIGTTEGVELKPLSCGYLAANLPNEDRKPHSLTQFTGPKLKSIDFQMVTRRPLEPATDASLLAPELPAIDSNYYGVSSAMIVLMTIVQ